MPSIVFYTLGCKVNTYESNALMNLFSENGYEVKAEDEVADVYIINTCSVTNSADAKSRKMINRAIKQNPNAVICVMGCYSQTNKGALVIEGVDIILGNGNKSQSLDLINEALKNKTNKQVNILDIRNTLEYEPLEATTFDHTRAFVKIQDGCNNFCTYCIIPYARGPVRSKDKDKVIEEVSRIVESGYEEVVFAGIHTGKYSSGDNYKLSDLIEDVLIQVPNLKRLRLSSIEINEIDDKLLNLMKDNRVLANHLHLPLQSGCDKILTLMNRKYDKEFFLNKIKEIRKVRSDISITTDVIVGFPYETDEDFMETYEFIKQVNFAELHVFPYSQRSGTKASEMPQINGNIKKTRVKQLLDLSSKLNEEYNKQFIGTNQDMIVEMKVNDEYMVGHTSNYLKVFLPDNEDFYKKDIQVTIKSIRNNDIFGEIQKK